MTLKLDDSISYVKGIGAERARLLKSINIITVSDALDYWPRKHDDYSKITAIKNCRPGKVTIKARITGVSHRYAKRGLHITKALATDASDSMSIIWFNQPYRHNSIKSGVEYYISGDYDVNNGYLSLANPTVVEVSELSKSSLIQAVYPETKRIKSSLIRNLIKNIYNDVQEIKETLPETIVQKFDLISRHQAIKLLHQPSKVGDLNKARERLAFEELFQMQLASLLLKEETYKQESPAIKFDADVIKSSLQHLGFDLTDDQRVVLWQIFKDMDKSVPMNRLVEGDVGSGKTAVAALASLMVIKNDFQVLFMAPTEILAKQHFSNLKKLFNSIDPKITIGLLVGSMSNKEKASTRAQIRDGKLSVIVGTHALIEEKTNVEKSGLVIVDEQHRFGVNQRLKLKHSDGTYPHFLSMTATPIPRSLALTLYGELDLSIIRHLPKGRKKIKTEIINNALRYDFYLGLNKQISDGHKIFVVCPLIEKSESLNLASATEVHSELASGVFKKRRVGLIHGRMKSDEKDKVMLDFKNGDLDVIVATTVIEVGVDIPDANIMVIESAERFGLAQIHQLRGRVGRGSEQGYCFLIPSSEVGKTRRLRAVSENSDGFKLAELDLELRGPGAIYGVRQTGVLDLRIARFDDRKLISITKKAAQDFIMDKVDMLEYPELVLRIKHFQSLTILN